MNKLLSSLLLAMSSLTFASSCPDANQRAAKIGGDIISGHVQIRQRPLKLATVRLYLGDQLIWRGATDNDGRFEIDHLGLGRYRLVVARWGSANIELNSELSWTGLHQRPAFNLVLSDNGCVGVVTVIN
jgi:hypothetical protein